MRTPVIPASLMGHPATDAAEALNDFFIGRHRHFVPSVRSQQGSQVASLEATVGCSKRARARGEDACLDQDVRLAPVVHDCCVWSLRSRCRTSVATWVDDPTRCAP